MAALRTGDYLTIAGRRWIVEAVDDKAKVIRVVAAPACKVPNFPAQEGVAMHDRLIDELRSVCGGTDRPAHLDATGWGLLQEGRETFAELGRKWRRIAQDGDDAFERRTVWRGA